MFGSGEEEGGRDKHFLTKTDVFFEQPQSYKTAKQISEILKTLTLRRRAMHQPPKQVLQTFYFLDLKLPQPFFCSMLFSQL